MSGNPLRVASDCSGLNAPWLALDLIGAPFHEIWYADPCPWARHLAELNRRGQPVECRIFGNILERDSDEIADTELDLYVSGPPCQGFSSSGWRLGARDPRFEVFLAACDAIATALPAAWLLENVEIKCANALQQIEAKLDRLRDQYSIHRRTINARSWLAQNRVRLFIVGIRRKLQEQPFQFPRPPEVPLLTLRDILEQESNVPDYCRHTTPLMRQVLSRAMQRVGADNFAQEAYVLNVGSSAGRLSCLLECCPAITRRSRPYVSKLKRRLHPTELQRLMGFPDTFDWGGMSVTRRHLLLGNSMVVYLVADILRAMLAALGRHFPTAAEALAAQSKTTPPPGRGRPPPGGPGVENASMGAAARLVPAVLG